MRPLPAVCCLLGFWLTACSAPQVASPELRSTVHRLRLPWGGSSATSVAPGYLLATRHQLRGDDLTITFEFNGRTYRALPSINGEPRELRLIAQGNEKIITDDWSLLESLNLSSGLYAYDPCVEVPPGTPVLLAGYPATMLREDGGDRPMYEPLVLHSRTVCASEVRNASLSEGWEWGDGRKMICRLPRVDEPLGGLSGGAALVWDASISDWVIIGIVYGTFQQVDERSGQVLRQGRHVVVIRPDVAEAIRDAATPQ